MSGQRNVVAAARPRVLAFSTAKGRAAGQLFYERRIGSLGALTEEAAVMDEDSGIRVVGKYEGRKCYVFVSRSGSRYAVMIYEIKAGKGRAPGKRLATEEVEGVKGLRRLLKGVVAGRVEAYAY